MPDLVRVLAGFILLVQAKSVMQNIAGNNFDIIPIKKLVLKRKYDAFKMKE